MSKTILSYFKLPSEPLKTLCVPTPSAALGSNSFVKFLPPPTWFRSSTIYHHPQTPVIALLRLLHPHIVTLADCVLLRSHEHYTQHTACQKCVDTYLLVYGPTLSTDSTVNHLLPSQHQILGRHALL